MFDSFRCVPPGSQRGNSNVAQWELSRKTISELMGESDIAEADPSNTADGESLTWYTDQIKAAKTNP
jgi:hypothetical protein